MSKYSLMGPIFVPVLPISGILMDKRKFVVKLSINKKVPQRPLLRMKIDNKELLEEKIII